MLDNFYGGFDFGTSGARISIIDHNKELIYSNSASYGHFGRRDLELPWENVEEKAAQLAKASKIFL